MGTFMESVPPHRYEVWHLAAKNSPAAKNSLAAKNSPAAKNSLAV